MNAKREELDKDDKAESEKKKEEKKEEQKKEEEKQKKAAKSEHDDKYFVVHKAECACDKAENPKQTAKLLVTSHDKVVLNDQDGKFFATEVDKTFDPPAATFGKCKLQPSSSGYLPCTLSPAPKWTKVYEKTQVLGNKVLTEISTLQCTIGGKIEIVKHGQTDSVMKEHADNTNPAAIALINPAVKMPVAETAYPNISGITLKSLENDPAFKSVSSSEGKKVEQVMVRPNTECTFEAKVKKGNVALTSWVIYDGHTGDKNKKLLTSEQVGTSFKNSFPTLGKYRVEGYGKPKREDFEKGKFDKNYPDCSIDVEVTHNKLVGNALLPIDGENFAKVIGGKMRLRQNFPASFKAKFLMPPTSDELGQLRLYVTDASGNTIDSIKVNHTVSFTPVNTKAQYKIIAEYKLDSGEVLSQSFTAETISNSVSAITHTAEVIRPGTAMAFSVKEGTFSFYVPDDELADAAIEKELKEVKWNLNGRLLGSGKSINIPGHEFMRKGKYIVEAYVHKANAYGATAKDEEDDWHFEVKDNDVLSFSYLGAPKVGKTTKLEVSSFVFANVLENEQVVWQTAVPHKALDKKSISITPAVAGKQNVKCSINNQNGVTLSIDVKQAKVLGMLFTDSNGIEIQRASWGQKINIWLQQEYLTDEDIIVEVWDNDTFDGDDNVAVINKNKYDGGLISFVLDSSVKQKTGDHGKLYVRIGAPKLKLANANAIFESKNYLDVQDKREIYGAHIGSQHGKDRHYHTDYDKISYFYAKSRGIKTDEQLNLTIYEKDKKLLEATNVHADESGMIKIRLEWNLISLKVPMRIVHAVVKDKEDNILYNGARMATGPLVITKKSALLSLAEYKSAVLVGNADASKNQSGTCVCKEYDLIWGNKVSCDFRKKVVEICKELWKDNYLEMANNLMAVFYWETGGTFKTDVPNQSKSGATGLIQFMPEKADEYFGKHTIEIVPNYFNTKNKDLHNLPRVIEFAKMTVLQQLDYVKKYFEPQKNKKLKFVDFYLQVLFPVSSGKEEHVVFADEESKLDLPSENKKIKEKRVSKYAKNSGLDLDKNGKIFKSEIGKTVEKYKTEGLAYKNISECKNIKKSNITFPSNCTVGKVIDGFIINDKVTKNKVDSCNNTSMPEDVKIIVLHRTAGGKASGTLNWMSTQGYGAHFVNDYDGTMYQAIGLDKKASHMGVNRKKSTIDNGWGNGNSIGIETCGLSLDKDGISTLISKKPHDHWEPVTNEQAQSIACLLKFLLNHFNLSVNDIKTHEELCLKTELEGKLVYDAMLPYLK